MRPLRVSCFLAVDVEIKGRVYAFKTDMRSAAFKRFRQDEIPCINTCRVFVRDEGDIDRDRIVDVGVNRDVIFAGHLPAGWNIHDVPVCQIGIAGELGIMHMLRLLEPAKGPAAVEVLVIIGTAAFSAPGGGNIVKRDVVGASRQTAARDNLCVFPVARRNVFFHEHLLSLDAHCGTSRV